MPFSDFRQRIEVGCARQGNRGFLALSEELHDQPDFCNYSLSIKKSAKAQALFFFTLSPPGRRHRCPWWFRVAIVRSLRTLGVCFKYCKYTNSKIFPTGALPSNGPEGWQQVYNVELERALSKLGYVSSVWLRFSSSLKYTSLRLSVAHWKWSYFFWQKYITIWRTILLLHKLLLKKMTLVLL